MKAILGLVCGVLALALAACGQKGALVLPQEPAAQQRATLPQILLPYGAASQPARPASAPQ